MSKEIAGLVTKRKSGEPPTREKQLDSVGKAGWRGDVNLVDPEHPSDPDDKKFVDKSGKEPVVMEPNEVGETPPAEEAPKRRVRESENAPTA